MDVGEKMGSTECPPLEEASNSSGVQDEFLQLIKLVPAQDRSTTAMQLIPQTMDSIFLKTGDLAISVIFTCGTSQKENRLLLSYIIRRLEGLEKGDEVDWIGWEENAKPQNGFHRSGGGTSQDQSQGVWMWSKPFIIQGDGKEVAAVLVDAMVTTDGLSTNDVVLSAIAGLGLLISSVMVLNSTTEQLDSHLLALHNHIQVCGCLDSGEGPETSAINIPKLSFLVREWNNPSEFPYGVGGGALYLEDKLEVKEDHSAEEKQVREMLQKCFREWACFLLPNSEGQALKPDSGESMDQHHPKLTDDLESFVKGTTFTENCNADEEEENDEEDEGVTPCEHSEQLENVAASTLDELVSSHLSQLSGYANANTSDDPDDLQGAHMRIKSEMIEKFWQKTEPGKDAFDREYLGNMEDAMDLNFVNIKTEHEDYIQSFQKYVQKSIGSFCCQYEEKLFNLDASQLDDPELHSRETRKIIKEFQRELSLIPRSSSRRSELEQRLKDGLQQVWDRVHVQVSQRRKMESFEKAKDAALSHYLEKIRSIKSDLLDAIEKKYIRIKDENKAARELALSKARDHLNRSLDRYGKYIKEEMDGLTNLGDLQQCHRRAKANTLTNFKDTVPIRDVDQMKQFERELRKRMETMFEKLKNEETIRTRELLAETRARYHDEMEKHCKNNLFIWPAHLEDIHESIKAAILLRFERKSTLSQLTRLSLTKDIDELYGIYEMKNDMSLNTGDMGAPPAIGIDLGTTYCCVAVYYKGKVHIIRNEAQGGIETTPSYVAFNRDGTETLGKTAKDDSYKNPEHTIYDAKRIIGRKIDDPSLQSDMKYWPFTVEEHEGVPKVMVNWKPIHPERISGKLLAYCKRMAEKFLKIKKGTIRAAVITVPAYFDDSQRQATVDAGKLANLNVQTILNEPTAAAIAYTLERLNPDPRNILIYDLGGGTFDVAVLNMKPKNIVVLGVKGDTHLGGENFDRKLMEYCVKKFKQLSGIDLSAGKDSTVKQERDDTRRRLRRLETHCEKAKKKLSSAETITVNVDAIINGVDLAVTVKREKFEKLNMADFNKSIQLVKDTLGDVGLERDAIDDVVLVGGSSRIPKVQQMLEEFFGGKALNKSIHPDLAVAYGAAVQAALMNGEQAKGQIEFSQIQDVTPMPLGVEIVTKELSVILPKNTKIPTRKKQVYYTVKDNQTSVEVFVFQGEDLNVARHNKLLGQFTLTGIPPKIQGKEPLDIWMEINSMGILHVEAVCRSNGNNESITVKENKLRMSDETIQEILNEDADSGRDTDQDQDQDETDEGDITSLLLQSSLGELAELAKKVDAFSGPHLDRQYRSLRADLDSLRLDLDGLDDTGREVLLKKKGRALGRISMLSNEMALKVHTNGNTCPDCEVPQEE